jgi:hypothetical protein
MMKCHDQFSRHHVVLSAAGCHTVGVFLGDDLLAWLILALGGALCAGNVMALIKPPPNQVERAKDGDLAKAPVGRSVLMGAVGLIAAVWALASLLR